ncbi:hypothetical protein IQ06DRAFT_344148 [Phaeosphaeriaceae sp. SRC1lsM3a]|nr:hypothetical protein IQ06DRAFT_344148 [Stagonospora sp. SRC1lsM3a]
MASYAGPSKKRKVLLTQAVSDEDTNAKPQKKRIKTKETRYAPSDIFRSEARAPFIEDEPRSSFCAAYHHHAGNEPCYTSIQPRPDNDFIHSLYAPSTHDELLTLSMGVAPPNHLTSIMHLASGCKQKLKTVKSSPQMLEAEKLVLEIEMRLERAKMALEKARGVGMDRKAGEDCRGEGDGSGDVWGDEDGAEVQELRDRRFMVMVMQVHEIYAADAHRVECMAHGMR